MVDTHCRFRLAVSLPEYNPLYRKKFCGIFVYIAAHPALSKHQFYHNSVMYKVVIKHSNRMYTVSRTVQVIIEGSENQDSDNQGSTVINVTAMLLLSLKLY